MPFCKLYLVVHLLPFSLSFSFIATEETPVTPLAAIFIGIAASLVLTATVLTLLARLRRRKVKKGSSVYDGVI